MDNLAALLEKSDPRRWFWIQHAADRGSLSLFLRNFSEQVDSFNSGSSDALVVFRIGRVLNGHVNELKREICFSTCEFDTRVSRANQAIKFYQTQLAAGRRTINH